jgi:glutamine phosphoribosylpyrophosphate amidotransferase
MCEILAVAASEDIAFDTLLPWARGLEHLGVAGFGWGVAWLVEDGVRRYRNAGSLGSDPEGARSVAPVMSSRFLVHLRRPNRLSTAQLADSQPFLDALAEEGVGRFALCHNGFLERHAGFRPRYRATLRGRADSEVGFEFLRERLAGGSDPAESLAELHQRLGGTANLGHLGADGKLLVYGGNPSNPLWLFESSGLTVAATGLHSDDDSLFDLLFTEATNRRRIGPAVVRIDSEVGAARRGV